MKIISNFKDYYDSVQKSSTDLETKFVRQEQIVVEGNRFSEKIYIGFCGNVYPAYYEYSTGTYVYTLEAALQAFDNQLKENKSRKPYTGLSEKKSIKHWFQNKDKYVHFFDVLNCAIFSITHNEQTLIINPCLKCFSFYRAKDSYTAYTELYKWVANRVTAEAEPPAMDNKTKIEQHGFDLKESFRKK